MTRRAPLHTLLARDIMERRPSTVPPQMLVHDAVRLLLKEKRTSVPVVEDGRVIGLLTEKGCVKALLRAVEYRLPASSVRDVMNADVALVDVDAHVLTVAHRCIEATRRRVMVVDGDGKLVGVITRRDLLRATVEVFDTAPDRNSAVLYLSATGSKPPMGRRAASPARPG
jgi:CBS-domain-containing membrane protein